MNVIIEVLNLNWVPSLPDMKLWSEGAILPWKFILALVMLSFIGLVHWTPLKKPSFLCKPFNFYCKLMSQPRCFCGLRDNSVRYLSGIVRKRGTHPYPIGFCVSFVIGYAQRYTSGCFWGFCCELKQGSSQSACEDNKKGVRPDHSPVRIPFFMMLGKILCPL